MIGSRIYWWVIGILTLLLGLTVFYSSYQIKQKKKEINELNISIIHLNLEIQSLNLDKIITDRTSELGLRLTSNVHLDIERINTNYNRISQNMQKKINETDKANIQAVSEIVIDSLWEGYAGAK